MKFYDEVNIVYYLQQVSILNLISVIMFRNNYARYMICTDNISKIITLTYCLI